MKITNNVKCFSCQGWLGKNTHTPELARLDCGTLVCPQSNLYLLFWYGVPFTPTGKGCAIQIAFHFLRHNRDNWQR